MPKEKARKYKDVSASPVKSFFVNMLTRDIYLNDAILDLLDNCVDGILRTKRNISGDKPYKDYKAEINFSEKSFSIKDNCGGIPWELSNYAFRMGRLANSRDADIPTVGTYGIGMKRALFKIGKHIVIQTQHKSDLYQVEMTPEWIENETDWDIPVKEYSKRLPNDGTTIIVNALHPDISILFGKDKESFGAKFRKQIETHYAFIINKGLAVIVNGEKIVPKPTRLVFAENPNKKGIQPFIYTTEINGVKVFLTVGFTRPIPSVDEVNDEQSEKRYSSLDAGWTILCNDRAVVYCDRTMLTGWGEAGVPRYHTQFIAISGIVDFQSDDASKLPTTTTKRGIDTSSSLYLQVKNKMREGMSLFTDYTNKWKGKAEESKTQIDGVRVLNLNEIKKEVEKLRLNNVKDKNPGKQFKPKLPLPKQIDTKEQRISFLKKMEEIKIVSEYLFGDENVNPSKVGEKCFDNFLEEADS